MLSIFTRFLDYIRGRRTEPKLDPESAQQGLDASAIDGDSHTTQVLMDELGIRSRLDEPARPDEERDRKAA